MAFRRLRSRLASLLAKFVSSMATELSPPISFLNIASKTEVTLVAELAHTPSHIAVARHYKIIQVAWLKESGGVQHEALEFLIQAPASYSHREYWLLADRVGRRSPLPSPQSSVVSLNDSVQQSANLSLPVPAYDRIAISETSTSTDSNYQIINTLELPKDAQLSLSNVLALLYSVSSGSKLYELFGENCFWFARGVYSAIQAQYPGAVKTKLSSRRAGYFGHIPITPKATEDFVIMIIAAWSTKMDEYNKLKTTEEKSAEDEAKGIAKGRLSEEVRTAKERCEREKAEQKAQEAERKAQEAERKAEEAERKIQEAERKAQEAERKAREAERKVKEAEKKVKEAEKKAKKAEEILDANLLVNAAV